MAPVIQSSRLETTHQLVTTRIASPCGRRCYYWGTHDQNHFYIKIVIFIYIKGGLAKEPSQKSQTNIIENNILYRYKCVNILISYTILDNLTVDSDSGKTSERICACIQTVISALLYRTIHLVRKINICVFYL